MTFENLSKQLNTSVQSLPNLVQVLSAAFSDMEGGGSSHDYSAEEHVIGKWIDGTTDVYEITVNITSPATADTSATIYTFSSEIIPIEITGIIDGTYDINTYWDNDTHIRTWISGDKLRCNVKGGIVINKNMVVTVRYIKSTAA